MALLSTTKNLGRVILDRRLSMDELIIIDFVMCIMFVKPSRHSLETISLNELYQANIVFPVIRKAAHILNLWQAFTEQQTPLNDREQAAPARLSSILEDVYKQYRDNGEMPNDRKQYFSSFELLILVTVRVISPSAALMDL